MDATLQKITSCLLGLVGGVAGGVLGYYTFVWIVHQGFYGLMIPGALLGLGCGLLSQHHSAIRGLVCAAAAVGLGLFSEWKTFPFIADSSFGYFMNHVHELKPLTLIMTALGACFAYWLGKDAGFRRLSGPGGRASSVDKTDTTSSP
jgi:hypothetical protein